ncbi:hypothetical protein N8468_05655 [Planktomarina temperata]|nr:hypothetical protein [Planktomarina temperata]MDC1524179.1 hypothetical protein [Planktomarina temperata]
MPKLSVSAKLTCAVDGVQRLVTDVARFGFELRELDVRVLENGHSKADLEIASRGAINCDMIAHRFGRHPGILAVKVAIQKEQKR